ncbi:MAG: hypothetical protein V3U94_02870 [Candidatus Thorarchaeota archaeon]
MRIADPASIAVGELNFADGLKNKKVYLTGFEAGINVVMQYWKGGLDTIDAEENLEYIKDMIKKNSKAVTKSGPKIKRKGQDDK